MTDCASSVCTQILGRWFLSRRLCHSGCKWTSWT